METKNIFLAGITFAVAVGSAYASLLAPENIFVKAKLTSSATAPTVCVNTQETCDDTGSTICRVLVPVQTGSGLASTTGSVKTFKVGCTIVLKNTGDERISTIPPVYRLVTD